MHAPTIPALIVAPGDDVATLLADGAAGDMVAGGVTLTGPVPAGHKVALRALAVGATVTKFGAAIGRATRQIAAGDHVHSHNLATALTTAEDYAYAPLAPRPAIPVPATTFLGYPRPDGRVGTRNEIWVLPTVGCVARTAERIAALGHAARPAGIDGVYAYSHPHGCSQLGQDLAGTRAILASLAAHPNAAGALIVGLGCEENQLVELVAEIAPERRATVRTLSAQDSADEVAEGCALVAELCAATAAERVPARFDRLVLGVKCGGSDGLSGLTANPLVGRMSDAVTGAGGAVLLTEIPEMFGAERLLMARAADRDVFDATVALITDFKAYFVAQGELISENPSPGNIAGGITTLEEKSLGAVQKAGGATVTDVIGYGARAAVPGVTLLEAPGNDAVSSTALAAAGASVILFTTGRGTPLGFPVPTLKLASNSALAARKPGWIDFDAGAVLTEGFDTPAAQLLDLILATASGAETAAERNGEREIAIWKRGVTL
ncbi:MAG: altronate dehydratase family protein [Pseudomonadota bacterium]